MNCAPLLQAALDPRVTRYWERRRRLIDRGLLVPSSGGEASGPSSPEATSSAAEVAGGTKQRQVEQ